MKALALYPGKKEVHVIQIPDARLDGAGSVLIRPIEIGICGTDRELVRCQYGTPPAGLDYLVLGHEMLGEVDEVGSGVTGFRKGDLVVPTVRRPCTSPTCV